MTRPNPPARASGVKPSDIDAILAQVRRGIGLKRACALLMVPWGRVMRVRAADEKVEARYQQARAGFEADLLAILEDPQTDHHLANRTQWRLERLRGETYGPPKQKQDITLRAKDLPTDRRAMAIEAAALAAKELAAPALPEGGDDGEDP